MRRLLSRSQHPHEVCQHAARLAGELARDPETRVLVLRAILPHLPDEHRFDGSDWPAALHRWARSVRHVREPAAVGELLLHPSRVVEFGAGDCDDIALAVATFAAHVGLASGVLSLWTGPETAHAVAVVGVSWYGPEAAHPSLVIDPATPEVRPLLSEPYRLGRLFPVQL